MMITSEMFTGRSQAHLTVLSGQYKLHPDAVAAFHALQQAAAPAGFTLCPASAFRDFERQRQIWNDKFHGNRPLLDADSQPIDALSLTVAERCHAILRWSALPGASRHHWGSDVDIYDPTLLPAECKLQLEPWEYQPGGYFYPLSCWLAEHLADYHFYLPFNKERGGVAMEPWHLSYRPLAQQIQPLLTPAVLIDAWSNYDIAGYDWLVQNIDAIFAQYITPTDN